MEAFLSRSSEHLRAAVRRFGRQAQARSEDVHRRELAHLYDHHAAPAVYTSELSIAFAAEFLTLNYDKYSATLEGAGLEDPRSVLDLGAGGGAFSAAALTWLSVVRCAPDRLVLLDRSSAQLRLAKELLFDHRILTTGGGPQVSGRRVKVRLEHGDVLDSPSSPGERHDLVLAGHVLTENIDRLPAVLGAIGGMMSSDGALLVVEQADDPVWDVLADAGRRAGFIVSTSDSASVRRRGDRPAGSRWALLRPRDAWRRALLDKYISAWRRQDGSQLHAIFTADALYHEKPFDEPLRGLPGIEAYWSTVVAMQGNPRPRLRRVLAVGDEVVAEWQTVLGRELGGHPVRSRVHGVLWVDVDPGQRRMSSLREYFRAEDEPVAQRARPASRRRPA